MTYYWIHINDLDGQEVVDEAEVDDKVCYVKVTELRGATAYHTEQTPMPEEVMV